MLKTKIAIVMTLFLLTSIIEAKNCSLKDLSVNNYKNCLNLIPDFKKAHVLCTCIEKNMNWEFMVQKNTFIDQKKCEFTKLSELLSDREALAKCPQPE